MHAVAPLAPQLVADSVVPLVVKNDSLAAITFSPPALLHSTVGLLDQLVQM